MRHAEAGQAGRDFDRCLTEYGIGQAKNVATQLSGLISPQLMIVSTAARTRETSRFLAEALGLEEHRCRYEDRAYEASTEDLKNIIAELPEDISEILLVGHNPSVSSLVSSWTDSYTGFSTACSTILEVDCDCWAECIYKSSKIVAKILPKH